MIFIHRCIMHMCILQIISMHKCIRSRWKATKVFRGPFFLRFSLEPNPNKIVMRHLMTPSYLDEIRTCKWGNIRKRFEGGTKNYMALFRHCDWLKEMLYGQGGNGVGGTMIFCTMTSMVVTWKKCYTVKEETDDILYNDKYGCNL